MGIYGVGSDHSTNGTTTTTVKYFVLRLLKHKVKYRSKSV